MKNIILSSGSTMCVYSVPDKIADNLEDACWYFRAIWIFDSPQNERFVKNGIACYNGKDFIDYLNNWEMPEFKSILIETLNCSENHEVPEKYKECPQYSF
ncbi:MAG: hypothetical protein IKC03_07410 [Oscillospiraceae bacterium]|nr:hypothetical protein [Oscillospiraceae bacterium]